LKKGGEPPKAVSTQDLRFYTRRRIALFPCPTLEKVYFRSALRWSALLVKENGFTVVVDRTGSILRFYILIVILYYNYGKNKKPYLCIIENKL